MQCNAIAKQVAEEIVHVAPLLCNVQCKKITKQVAEKFEQSTFCNIASVTCPLRPPLQHTVAIIAQVSERGNRKRVLMLSHADLS